MVIDSAQLSSLYLVSLHDPTHLQDVEVGLRAKKFQRLIDLQLPIPPTFIVTPHAISEFFEQNHFTALLAQIFAHLNWSDVQAVQAASQTLMSHIHHFHFPQDFTAKLTKMYVSAFDGKFVAVRPSLLFTDYHTDHLSDLSVHGEANIAESILRVLAKIYRPEYLKDRYQEWQQEKFIPAAIMIQHMVDARASGLALSAHPGTGDQHTIFISSTWGISTMSPSQIKNADTFEVDTRTWQVAHQQVHVKTQQYVYKLDHLEQTAIPTKLQAQPSLNTDDAISLAKITNQLGRTGFTTQVVEWAKDSTGHLLILNAFPVEVVKTLPTPHPDHVLARSPGTTQLKVLAAIESSAQAHKESPWLADSVGLINGNFIFRDLGIHPHALLDQRQGDQIKKEIVHSILMHQATHHQTATTDNTVLLYRCQDLTSQELLQLEHGENFEPKEKNPFLGYRGALRSIHSYDIFNLEMESVTEAQYSLKHKIGVVLPFVRTSTEFALMKKHLLAHTHYSAIAQNLWVECSVPALIFQMKELLLHHPAGVVVSIAELYALMCGIDPQNADVVALYPIDEKVIGEILTHVAETVKNTQTKVRVYLPSLNHSVIEAASQYHFEAVMVEPRNIPKAREIIQLIEQQT